MDNGSVRLADGTEMPALGLGTWQLAGSEARAAVDHALQIGYRMIDTSGDYGNQPEIGIALRSAPVEREEVFLVTKTEEDEDPRHSAHAKLAELGVDRVDLLLLHRPPPEGAGEELWEGLLDARADGLAAAVGVSNYTPAQIDALIESSGEAPAVNQVEWSPFGHSRELLDHARENRIALQAYSPLTRGSRLTDPRLAEIGNRHGRSPAQILLRWDLQLGLAPIPKAATGAHREENFDVFDFELDEEEVEALGELNERYSSLSGLPYV